MEPTTEQMDALASDHDELQMEHDRDLKYEVLKEQAENLKYHITSDLRSLEKIIGRQRIIDFLKDMPLVF